MNSNTDYINFLKELKQSILKSRYIAMRLANREQLVLYYNTGLKLSAKVNAEKWGTKTIQQLATDLQNELPGLRGFSYRNLMKMRQFYEAYISFSILPPAKAEIGKSTDSAIVPLLTAQLSDVSENAFFSVSFSHHILLLNKCKNIKERLFYMNEAATQFWSVSILKHKIDSKLFHTQGALPNNFNTTLPETMKTTALQVFQDEYLFDFISLEDVEDERIFESKIIANIRQFILSIGKGFSFIGNQYRIELDGEEYWIDLLFYNRHLQCLIAFELKRGKFKPAYAGQLNFYLNVLDAKVKLPHENPSIGIILCKEKSSTIVEYAFKSIDKAMGVATFKTARQVPKEMKGVLPAAKDLAKLLDSDDET